MQLIHMESVIRIINIFIRWWRRWWW